MIRIFFKQHKILSRLTITYMFFKLYGLSRNCKMFWGKKILLDVTKYSILIFNFLIIIIVLKANRLALFH